MSYNATRVIATSHPFHRHRAGGDVLLGGTDLAVNHRPAGTGPGGDVGQDVLLSGGRQASYALINFPIRAIGRIVYDEDLLKGMMYGCMPRDVCHGYFGRASIMRGYDRI